MGSCESGFETGDGCDATFEGAEEDGESGMVHGEGVNKTEGEGEGKGKGKAAEKEGWRRWVMELWEADGRYRSFLRLR